MTPRLCIPLVAFICLAFFTSCSPDSVLHVPTPSATPTKTDRPIIPTRTITPLPSPRITADPNLYQGTSPDGYYTVQLRLAETPIVLTVIDNGTSLSTTIPVTYRYYNELIGAGDNGFLWTRDNRTVMFELSVEPPREGHSQDNTCFAAIDVATAKRKTAVYSYSGYSVHPLDDSGIVWLEHGGLNDIYDFYIPGTNCFKYYFTGECTGSYISPSGYWEVDQWGSSEYGLTVYGFSEEIWPYAYPAFVDALENPVTVLHRWSADEQYVLFSPSVWYGMAWSHGLYRMDLASGSVESLVPDGDYAYVSVAPGGGNFFYYRMDGKLVVWNIGQRSERVIPFALGDDKTIGNYIWAPDETHMVFSTFLHDAEGGLLSMDYLILNAEAGTVIPFRENEAEYLNVQLITDDTVAVGETVYSLEDGSVVGNDE